MKRLAGLIIVAAFAQSAYADGTPGPYSPPVALQVSPWIGFYAGAHAGHAWGDLKNIDSYPANPNCWWCSNDYGDNADSFFGGGQIGYNFQAGQVVFGVEGELGFNLLDGDASDPVHITPNSHVEGDWYGTIAGRLGYAFRDVLVYGKAGWGWIDTEFKWSDPAYSAHASNDETLDGAVYGGGIEYAFSPKVSIKAEYLRFDVSDTAVLDVQGYCCGYQQLIEVDDIDTFKIGINFHFDGDRGHAAPLK